MTPPKDIPDGTILILSEPFSGPVPYVIVGGRPIAVRNASTCTVTNTKDANTIEHRFSVGGFIPYMSPTLLSDFNKAAE